MFDEPRGRYFINCPRCRAYILKIVGKPIKCRNCGYTEIEKEMK